MEFTTGSLYQFQDGPTQGSPFRWGRSQPVSNDYEVDARQFALFASYEQPSQIASLQSSDFGPNRFGMTTTI